MEKAKRGFAIHLIVYAIANVVLIAINLVHAPKTIWFSTPIGVGPPMADSHREFHPS